MTTTSIPGAARDPAMTTASRAEPPRPSPSPAREGPAGGRSSHPAPPSRTRKVPRDRHPRPVPYGTAPGRPPAPDRAAARARALGRGRRAGRRPGDDVRQGRLAGPVGRHHEPAARRHRRVLRALALAAGCRQGGRDRRRGTAELWESVPALPCAACSSRSPLRPLARRRAAPRRRRLSALHLAVRLHGPPLPRTPRRRRGRPRRRRSPRPRRRAPRPVAARRPAPGDRRIRGSLFSAYAENSTRWLGPAGEHVSYWDRPVWWYAPASMAWTAGLALAALLAHGLRPARLRPLALVPLAVAVAAASSILRLPPDEGRGARTRRWPGRSATTAPRRCA